MKAAVFKEAGQPLVIEEVSEPSSGDADLILQVHCCGICGTDLHSSAVPGGLPAGCVMGHEFAGTVVEAGKEASRDFSVGDRVTSVPTRACGRCVHCLSGDVMLCEQSSILGLGKEAGAFAEYVRVGSNEAVALPDAVDWNMGALVEPLSVGLHAVRVAGIRPGQNVLVLGGGPIGLAVSIWLRFFGARSVVVSEPAPGRRDRAQQLGATAALSGGEGLAEDFRDHVGAPPDVIFECVGLPGLLGTCIDLAAPRSKVIVAGVCMAMDSIFPAAAVVKELVLQFVLAYHKDDFSFAIDMLASGRIDPLPMVTDRVSLEGLPVAFEALRRPTTECKVLVEI
ncbi:MAG: alcohol dehydrogenase catalytic domain-containing protein [Myxococcota bacterium]|nr:alcohol dehydrogenase catalytic domain-containing protein [Myxococcota bacterium]